ncbi:hypothetical protein FOE78_14015 [Microlunatus elymi]|uniref:CDP-Glycerol:Poly(Glycerophosphate) glycerophosphotransferase n=1 Tax=Microlunatus elymi TaxID=2596828 RepID=A0A516Q0G3_9ACTN|nr:CDP-glycerol glycerophosphotransferase family protein [Microlunatus elymi]QDP96882.1 hypothetical protein FOE78_14015 [Microlunatus elymi]
MTQAGDGPTSRVLRRATASASGTAVIAALLAASAWSGIALGTTVGRWSAVLLLVLGLAGLAFRFPRQAAAEDPPEAIYPTGRLGSLLRVRNGLGGLGRFAGSRMLAAAAVVGSWTTSRSRGAGSAWFGTQWTGALWIGVGIAVLICTIAIEPFLVRLLRLPAPYARGLPGQPRLPERTASAWLIAPISLLVTALVAVLGAAGSPGWIGLLVAVAGVLPAGALVRQVRARRRVAARLQRNLADAVADYRPEFVLYTARPDDASYQLIMWLPYLARAGRRFLIVTRNELPAEAIARHLDGSLADVPVVCCRGVAELDLIMTESLRAAFYVNASSGNGALIRYHQLTHVYLGHGDSEKPPSYNPTHAMYDRIFTAGPAANRRYAAHGVLIDKSKFRVVGRPQVEVVRQPDPERIAERLAGAPPVILYAPTWRGHVSETALSSLDRAEAIVGALLARGARVIFRPHPFSYADEADTAIIRRVQAMLSADAADAANGSGHRYGPAAETELDALGCMNLADVMISDVSAVVSDFLFSGKPLAMIAPASSKAAADDLEQFVADYPVARAAYLIDHDLDRLPAALDELLLPAGDRLTEVRAEVRADYLGDFPVDGYADTFVDAVRAACDNPPPSIAEPAESDDGSTGVSRDTIRRNLDSLARTMISGVAAVAALTAALGGHGWVGLAAALIAALVAIPTLWQQSEGPAGTPLDGPRMILLLAAGAALGTQHDAGIAAVVTTVILIALALEVAVREGWEYPGVIADGLPELTVPATSPWLHRLSIGSILLSLLGFLLATVGDLLPGTVSVFDGLWALAAAAYLILIIIALRSARARLRAAVLAEASVLDVLRRRAPEFCVYFGSGIGAGYQVGMWLPYFIRIGRPFVIITRSLPMLTEIAALTRGTGVPVLYRPTLRSLEDVVVPSMKVAFYVNNAVRNTHLIERRELTHVWLNHGDSEKPACFNPVHAIYDKIFAAGQAAVDRYARHNVTIPAEKFMIVGRPQTEVIKTADAAARPSGQQTVLYAPTWQGPYADSRVYSLPQGQSIVAELLRRGVRVIFRAHPFNYRFAGDRQLIERISRMLEEDRRASGRQHLWGAEAEQQMSVEDCFNASDAMITDVSAVISDYLASGKPFAVVAVGRTEDELIAEAPAAAAGYPIAEDLGDLDDALDQLLITDPKGAERQQMRRYYLGDFAPGHAADGFLAGAAELLGDRVRT